MAKIDRIPYSPAAVPVCGAIICGVGPPTPRTGPVSPAGAAVAPIGTPLPAALPMPGPPPCDTPLCALLRSCIEHNKMGSKCSGPRSSSTTIKLYVILSESH